MTYGKNIWSCHFAILSGYDRRLKNLLRSLSESSIPVAEADESLT